jgi:predicted Co/Zn/Cd cation transporter (cation efflux family)
VRAQVAEINEVVPPDSRIETGAAVWIRWDIAQRMNAAWPNFWLTVDFTADRGWL